jgi:hypothetical protein
MKSVDDVLARYIERHRAEGEIDPLPYLDEVVANDRDELALQMRMSRSPWNFVTAIL